MEELILQVIFIERENSTSKEVSEHSVETNLSETLKRHPSREVWTLSGEMPKPKA